MSAVVVGEDGSPAARRWSKGIVALVIVQLLLGSGAWIANWGVPYGLLPDSWQLSEPLRARSVANAAVVTGHVVFGMLILAASVVLAIEAGATRSAVVAGESRIAGGGLASGRAFT